METPEFEQPKNITETLSPYFIQEATLEKTLEKLRRIEKSKRKIIIHVGVHLNEGTDVLVKKYATKWAEKYGATVVCQPTEETSQAIWARRKQETGGDATIPLPPDLILDEEEYANKFSFDNKDTLVVSFHGTPLRAYQEGASGRLPGLEVEISRYVSHPEDFKNRRHPILFSKPEIVKGIQIPSSSGVNNLVSEEKHQDDPLWYPNGPNTLLIEYFYEGKPIIVEDPYFRKLLIREKMGELTGRAMPLSDENWHRQMNIGPSYLGQDVLSEKDINLFHTTLVKDFEKVLQHLSNGLA
jgi:hypothetical protein